MKIRKPDLVVISDVHLGSYGCHASELIDYLKSIQPGILILNGDLVDIWQFRKSYWPDSHMKVLKCLMSMLTHGTRIYYLTGNHDEMLRKYSPFRLGNFHLVDKLVLEIDGKKAWIFHGDVFDVTMKYSKWVAKLGGKGYNLLIRLNKLINYFSMRAGKGRISISRRIKNSVKTAVKFISNFEQTATDLAIENGYSYVICGHIHRPNIKQFRNEHGSVTYLNSGDWVENLTALEYSEKRWTLYRHIADNVEDDLSADDLSLNDLVQNVNGTYSKHTSGANSGFQDFDSLLKHAGIIHEITEEIQEQELRK